MPRADEFLPAGFGRGGRRHARARPHHRGRAAWLRRPYRQQHGRDQRPRLHARVHAGRLHVRAFTSRASPKRSRSTPPRNSASSNCPRHSPPAPAPCRRRRIPTSPSCFAARADVSSEPPPRSPRCSKDCPWPTTKTCRRPGARLRRRRHDRRHFPRAA